MNTLPLREFDFGDYSGSREYLRNPQKFIDSFQPPHSFSLSALRNNGKFIIVGRKGTGKSSCCFALSHHKKREGYHSLFFEFSEDITRKDAMEAVQTQALNLQDLSVKKLFDSIEEFYDFRDLWRRKVLVSIRNELQRRGIRSPFTDLLGSMQISESSIAQGVGRGLTLPWEKVPNGSRHLFSEPKEKEISLSEYVKIGLQLLVENHSDEKIIFFFDELNVSHAFTKSDQYSTMISLIRDLVRASASLNDFFVKYDIDIHVICCLRPEVRDALIQRDNELSKTVEPNSASLVWPSNSKDDNPLMKLLLAKITNGPPEGYKVNPHEMLPDHVLNDAERINVPITQYVLNMTWYRPRDIIKMLDSYKSKNGDLTTLFDEQGDQRSFLYEYGRVSYNDCIAELEVKYKRELILEAFNNINRPKYRNLDELEVELTGMKNRLPLNEFIHDLFISGIILNVHKESGRSFVVASFQDDSEINPSLQVLIHRALQPRFQFRDLGGDRVI